MLTKRQRLGSLLVAAGTVTHEQLDSALSAQRQFRGRLGTNLVELRYLNLDELAAALSRQHGVPAAGRSDFLTMDGSLIHLLPPRAAKMYLAVPLGPSPTNPRVVQVAMMDPGNIVALDEISAILGCRVTPLVTPEIRMLHLLERVYGIKPERRTFLRVVLDRPLLQRSRRPSNTPPGAATQQKAHGDSLTPPSMLAVQLQTPSRDRKPPASLARGSSPATPYAPTEPPQPRLPNPPAQASSAAQRAPALEPLHASAPRRAMLAASQSLGSPRLEIGGERADRSAQDSLPLVGTYQEQRSIADALPTLDADVGLELDDAPRPGRDFGSPGAEAKSTSPVQQGASRLPLRNFIQFPRRNRGVSGLPDLALGELAEDDALALLNPLPEAREPAPAPPAPTDPTALAFDSESGRSRPSSRAPRSGPPAPLPILDYSLGSNSGRTEPGLPLAEPLDPGEQNLLAPENALARVLSQLESASDRDSVGQSVAHYLGSVFGCGVVLLVKGEVASGWIGAGPGLTSATVELLRVPLDEPSLFQTVVRTTKPHRGATPVQADPILKQFWSTLGAGTSREILVVPVVLKARVLHVIYAQSGPNSALPIMAEADAMQVAAGMVRAYQRLIQARHGG